MNAASWLEGLPAAQHWRERLRSDGPRIATWILTLGLAVQAALIITDLGSAGRKGAAVPGGHAAARLHALDVAAITKAHLFGAAPAAPENGANAPQTTMPLVLTGIIAGNDPQNGLAILGANAQTAKVFAVGDSVPGGAKLHSVYSDRVVIERNGQLESLALPRQVAGTAPPPTTASVQGNLPIERMRHMLTEQPGLIGDVMRPQAVTEHGKVTGFRVFPGRNRMAFMRLGLRPGDEVTAINGTPLDDQDRGDQILHTLGSSSEAHVTVIRNGQQQDLTLNIAQLEQEAEGLVAPGPAPPPATATQSRAAPGQAAPLPAPGPAPAVAAEPPGSDD
ncbi:MAG: GspC family type II secretion system variant ExeC [Steroidobacteraceae bacterium]